MNRGLKYDLIQNFAYALNQPEVTTPVITKSYEKDWESLLGLTKSLHRSDSRQPVMSGHEHFSDDHFLNLHMNLLSVHMLFSD